MDFAIPEEIEMLLTRVRTFVQEELYPLEKDYLTQGFEALEGILQEKRRKVWDMGLFIPQIEREYGGLGLTTLEYGLVGAELGKSPLGHYCFNCQAPDAGNMEILIKYGTDEQKERWLSPLLKGKIRSCFAMTEPDFAGSNPTWMGTTAVKDGDDYVINGRKWFCTGADGAAFAIVMAVTNPDAEPHLRASQIIVPTDTPGMRLVRNTPCMGHVGSGWASHGELEFENCRVPQSHLLGPEGAGFLIAQDRLGPGRIHHCMRWIGICERAYEIMCEHAAKRQVAPGVPLGSRQFAQGWIAESRAEIDAARLLVLQAAWQIDRQGTKEARDAISLIKFHVAGVMTRVLDRAIQMLGALGITDYTPLALFYRSERASHIYDGTDEIHKISFGKRVLKRLTGGSEIL